MDNDTESFKKAFEKFFRDQWLAFLIYFFTILGVVGTFCYQVGSFVSRIDNPKQQQQFTNKDSIDNVHLRKELFRLKEENLQLKKDKEEADRRKEEIENIVIYRMEAVRNEK